VSHAEPAGGGGATDNDAQSNGTEYEMQYAEPWDAEVTNFKLNNQNKFMNIFLTWLVPILCFFGSVFYLSEFIVDIEQLFTQPGNLIPLVLGYSISTIAIRCPNQQKRKMTYIIKEQGWCDNYKFSYFNNVRVYIPLLIILLFFIADFILWRPAPSGALFLFLIPFIFMIYIIVNSRSYISRVFLFDYHCSLNTFIERISELFTERTARIFTNSFYIFSGNEHIYARWISKEKLLVKIKSPERNRELREAVSAILEGRPWPLEASGSDAHSSGSRRGAWWAQRRRAARGGGGAGGEPGLARDPGLCEGRQVDENQPPNG